MKRTKQVNLSVSIGSVSLSNPTLLASGILGMDRDCIAKAARGGAGAVTIKSLTTEPRKGHNNPILIEFECGLMNAVGYANHGIDAGIEDFKLWDKETPMVGSVVGGSPEEFAILAQKMNVLPIVALELALSCPHTPGFGLLAGQGTPEATLAITKAVRKVTKLPLWIKLSPSVPGIGEVAKAAEAGGADAINMGNTAGPGMKIDIERAEPILHFKFGGMSGPAIKPLTIRSVWDVYQAVKIPIIATGGIQTGLDAIEAMMAGATAVGIGSGIYYRGNNVFKKVCDEMTVWLALHGYTSPSQIKGAVHEK